MLRIWLFRIDCWWMYAFGLSRLLSEDLQVSLLSIKIGSSVSMCVVISMYIDDGDNCVCLSIVVYYPHLYIYNFEWILCLSDMFILNEYVIDKGSGLYISKVPDKWQNCNYLLRRKHIHIEKWVNTHTNTWYYVWKNKEH